MSKLNIISRLKILRYRLKGYSIGKNVYIGRGSKILGKNVHIGNDVIFGNNVLVKAAEIEVGENCLFFNNVNVNVLHRFCLDSRCKISRKVVLHANSIIAGKELWCNEGVEVGGGGWKKKTANLYLGDNVHLGKNVMINVCQSVTIGSQTGIGIEAMILTHSSGHGQSVLYGYEHVEKAVSIGNNVSVYSRAFIVPGTKILDGAVVGAMSYARGTLEERTLYLGIPAKEARFYRELPKEVQYTTIKTILEKELTSSFSMIYNVDTMFCEDCNKKKEVIVLWDKPEGAILNSEDFFSCAETICLVNISGEAYVGTASCEINFRKMTMEGKTSFISERLRDIFRRYGIIFKQDKYVPLPLNYGSFINSGVEL